MRLGLKSQTLLQFIGAFVDGIVSLLLGIFLSCVSSILGGLLGVVNSILTSLLGTLNSSIGSINGLIYCSLTSLLNTTYSTGKTINECLSRSNSECFNSSGNSGVIASKSLDLLGIGLQELLNLGYILLGELRIGGEELFNMLLYIDQCVLELV